MRILAAGLVYFSLVFAAGAILGPVRVLWLEPLVGPLAAVLIEAPFLLLAMGLAARQVTRRLALKPGQALGAGLVGLAVLLATELAGAILLRAETVAAWGAALLHPAGLVSVALFAVFAAMPWVVARR